MTKQQWLQQQIANNPTLSARELTELLNDKVLIDNPIPQQTVAKIPNLLDVRLAISPSETFQFIMKVPELIKLLESAIASQDLISIQYYFEVALASGFLSDASKDNLNKLLIHTELDPSYQQKILISPAELAGFGIILVNEVEEYST